MSGPCNALSLSLLFSYFIAWAENRSENDFKPAGPTLTLKPQARDEALRNEPYGFRPATFPSGCPPRPRHVKWDAVSRKPSFFGRKRPQTQPSNPVSCPADPHPPPDRHRHQSRTVGRGPMLEGERVKWRAVVLTLAIVAASVSFGFFVLPSAQATIVKNFRTGTPADNGEITEPANHLNRLDQTGSGPSCVEQTINPGGDSIKAYDIKQAVTYAAGDWTLILDWNLNGRDSFTARVVITNAAGAEQSTIVNFGSSIVTQGPSSDQTLTVNKATDTTLLATQRLAVFIIHDQDESFSLRIGNFDSSCNTRLATPDVVGGCDTLTLFTSDPAGQLWFNETVEPDGLPFTTQVNLSASFQTGATPALSVTNDGSINCDVTIRFMSDPGTGRSLKFNTTNNAPWPADASKEVPLDPSSVTACSSVAPGGTCDIWLWADYESALGGQTVADVRVETI